MALVLKDRVLETCTAPGTGTVTLLGATTGYQTFLSAIGNANTTYYTIADQTGSNWEVGIGTYTSASNTLTRTTVLASSNGGSLTNFSSGTQNVFVTYPAEKSINYDINGVATIGSVLGYSDTGIIASFASSVAGYNQVILQNTSSGSTASANFNVSNNNGSATTNYGEFGINSSGFTGSGAFSTAGNVYLAAASTDLAIGTYGSNPIHFVVNSGAADALTISTAGNVTTPNLLTGAEVVASNGIFVNNQTIATSYSIPSGYSASSAGPVTVASGITVTVPGGSRWVVL
jgi:hypothetical protein